MKLWTVLTKTNSQLRKNKYMFISDCPSQTHELNLCDSCWFWKYHFEYEINVEIKTCSTEGHIWCASSDPSFFAPQRGHRPPHDGHWQQEWRRWVSVCARVQENFYRWPPLYLQLPAGLDLSSGTHHYVVLCFCHHVWSLGLQDHFR